LLGIHYGQYQLLNTHEVSTTTHLPLHHHDVIKEKKIGKKLHPLSVIMKVLKITINNYNVIIVNNILYDDVV
jgi:hypothetical protein